MKPSRVLPLTPGCHCHKQAAEGIWCNFLVLGIIHLNYRWDSGALYLCLEGNESFLCHSPTTCWRWNQCWTFETNRFLGLWKDPDVKFVKYVLLLISRIKVFILSLCLCMRLHFTSHKMKSVCTKCLHRDGTLQMQFSFPDVFEGQKVSDCNRNASWYRTSKPPDGCWQEASRTQRGLCWSALCELPAISPKFHTTLGLTQR